jgi:S1-C subfamily serine protease
MYVVDDHTIDTRFVMVGQDDQNLLQIDATIVQGNSGGPIVNAKGVVVGIAVMGKMAMGGLGSIAYAVSIDQAWPIVQQLIADGTAKRARIGMAFRLIRAAMDGLDALPDGVLTAMMVDDVAPRSPAAVAGLHRGTCHDVSRRVVRGWRLDLWWVLGCR